MDDTQIVEIWTMFKEYVDKKHVEQAAERYIDLMADMGTDDQQFTAALGHDAALDIAINYYLDLDEDDVLDEEVEWDE
jgi:hypothetical protein